MDMCRMSILRLRAARIWLAGNQPLSRQQRRAALPHKDTHLRGPGLRLEAASPPCLYTEEDYTKVSVDCCPLSLLKT
jgi:hypothetical protein